MFTLSDEEQLLAGNQFMRLLIKRAGSLKEAIPYAIGRKKLEEIGIHNEFEKELHDWGAVIIKFWVQIDKDTQLERFNERQNTPEKQWKITDDDWRNRDKWDAYETAVNEMIQKTSTSYAPWHILESVDKKYARIKALKIVVEELEKVLG